VTAYVCPSCRTPLGDDLHCRQCAVRYPHDDKIADFSRGSYYDQFNDESELTEEHRRGLANEETGARWRIEKFFSKLLPAKARVLDCGCGNGISVDLLNESGRDAWGIDLSALRKWQWRERVQRDRLAVASGMSLPFANGFFDVVISSGVIEHIGVVETGGATYTVTPMPDRDGLRTRFIAELLRVTRPGGTVFLDFPNGAFPIDFWHSHIGGSARWHSADEGFLPTFGEVRNILREIEPTVTLRALSPHRRFAFRQVGRHWYGRLFALPMTAWLFLMSVAGLRTLSRTALNPYLVIEIRRAGPD
jgi:SAM-dependent methyltransferase